MDDANLASSPTAVSSAPGTPLNGTLAPRTGATSESRTGQRPKSLAELLGYALGVTLTMLFLVAGQRLDLADWYAPFDYDYDALLILPFVKATVERGSHWRSERLGAPGIQELHDFAVIDHLHFGIIWLLSRCGERNEVFVFNLFHVLTYPLTTLTTMYVFRRFGLSMPAAIAGGLIYSFQPYHYIRGLQHYFLAAYFVIPLSLMVAFRITQGRLPFYTQEPDGRYRLQLWSKGSLATLLISAATASAGAYYAFFACGIYAIAGLYGWFATKTMRSMLSAGAVIGLVTVGGILNHLPMFGYHAQYGKNARPMQRMAEEGEIYASRIAQFLLPVQSHNPVGIGDEIWIDLAAIRSEYQAPLFKPLNESDGNAFGLIGAVGFVYLIALALFPKARPWPLGPLSSLALFTTLMATMGGIGALFNFFITPQVRCYNRIAIFLVFMAIFVVCWGLDQYFNKRLSWVRHLRWPVFLGLALFGIWDQTNDQWFPDLRIPHPEYQSFVDVRAKNAERYWSDRAFFEKVEEVLPEGMVYTYPYVEYPESLPLQEPGSPGLTENYEHVLGYLHTKNLRWSFGAVKGREADIWAKDVAGKWSNAPRFLEKIVLAGFDGLLIDARSIKPDRFQRLKSGIDQYVGHGALRVVDSSRMYYFYDLRGHREMLRRNLGEARFEALAKKEAEQLALLWLKGFQSYDMLEAQKRTYWCEPKGEILFVNRSSQPVTAIYQMQIRTSFQHGSARLQIQGGDLWTEDLEIFPEEKAPTITRTFVIPPGRHSVKFRCTPTISVLPGDSRNITFAIANLRRLDAE